MASSAIKKSTNLCNLAVCTNPKGKLTTLYARILKVLAKLPESSAYRKHTEELVRSRLEIVNKCSDPKIIEDQINCGQAEEVIVQAKNELELARRMYVYRPWQPLLTEAPANQWKWPPV